MSAGHGHGHHHDHSTTNRTRLAIAFGLTVAVLIVEVIMAFVTGSLALLVDAAHMLTDATGLAIALFAASLMARPPTSKRTWGFARMEVLAAGAQATILLAVGIFAFIEGIRRLISPPEVQGVGMLVIGIVGLLANVIALMVLAGGRSANLNMRAAFLEVVNDALGSVAVIIGAIVITLTGWTRADAIAGMLIAALIAPRAVMILREASSVLMETVPTGIDLHEVRAHLESKPHVRSVHDLHISRISTGLPVLTAHVVVEEACFTAGCTPQLLQDLQTCVAEHFDISIAHSTFQIEPPHHHHGEFQLHD
ncbi:cation diffusion facilitator family transporter [Granulicoccus sp. GXG6511]|uniref:cation diffusion facilitator family transporter n=1 Tax=Granulicoccus sp. GXG6511 TaxID=3381351 RepID=UPI003D7D95F6